MLSVMFPCFSGCLLEALEGVLSKAEKLDKKVEKTGRTGWWEIVWIH
jgi:hypothetical protein